MPRTIKLTQNQIDALQGAAMYGEPVGGRAVHLFVEEDYGSYPCGCCECCGCDCEYDEYEYLENDWDYDDFEEDDE